MSESYSVAMSKSAFDRMRDDPQIQITDCEGMGPMSEFDLFVSFSVVAEESEPFVMYTSGFVREEDH